MEQGVMVSNKGCSACAVGAACLADGPIPDFEVAGITGTFDMAS